jgi:hypothetical protein
VNPVLPPGACRDAAAPVTWRGRQTVYAHLVAPTIAALHRAAQMIGLSLNWYQSGEHPHYDLIGAKMIARADRLGLPVVTAKEMLATVHACAANARPTAKRVSLERIRLVFPEALRSPDPLCPDCHGTGFHRKWNQFTPHPCTCIFTTDELLEQLADDVGAHGCAPDRRTP